MNKPLLLLDVDGPLNPYAAKPTRRPEGYQTYRYKFGSFADVNGRPWPDGMRVWLNPDHGRELRALSDVVDLTWCTMWNEMANDAICPILDLPKLPVIETAYRFDAQHIFKLDDVIEYVGDKPFAWFDDDFMPDDLNWANSRAENGTPTLLMPIDPRKGLTSTDFSMVRRWAESIDG